MTDFKQAAFDYFRGEISPERERELYAWVKSCDSNLMILHGWEEEWKTSEQPGLNDKWTRILGRVAARETLEEGVIHTKRRNTFWWYAVSAAAAVAIVLVFALRPTPMQLYAMEAPAGEKCRVFLPDSSVVWLNSGSRISFDESFNVKSRNVTLVGEGYFDVTHNDKKPFVVNCGQTTVLVKGTKFNVSAYEEDRFVETSVTDGHVVFSHGPAHLDLYKGQSARFDMLSRRFSRSTEDPSDASGWTESRFVYNNINLSALAEKLSRTYAVKFHFNTTEYLDKEFSISLRNNETLPEVLKALEQMIPVRTRIEGQDVYIDKK